MPDDFEPTDAGDDVDLPADAANEDGDGQDGDEGGEGGGQADVTSAAPGEAVPKKAAIKPIPNRSKASKASLPGVVMRGAAELFGDKTARDSAGRFRKLENPVDDGDFDDVEDEPDAHEGAPGEAAPAKPAPKPTLPGEVKPGEQAAALPKFKFADEEYDSQDKAEQAFRSLRGMFKPLQEKASRAEALEREALEWDRSNKAWQEELKLALSGKLDSGRANILRQQLGIAGAGSPSTKAAGAIYKPDGSFDVDALIDPADMDAFAIIAADPDGGLPAAGKFLAQRILSTMHESLVPVLKDALLKEVQPVLSSHARSEQVSTADAVVDQLAALKESDGSVAFPELADEAQVQEIGAVWRAYDRPLEELLTPRGLMNAVALYRMEMNRPSRKSATTTPTAIPGAGRAAASPTPKVSASGAAASVADGGRGTGAGARVSRGPDAQAQQLLNALADTSLVDSNLGFRRNNRNASF